jgi:hypothetical protein
MKPDLSRLTPEARAFYDDLTHDARFYRSSAESHRVAAMSDDESATESEQRAAELLRAASEPTQTTVFE